MGGTKIGAQKTRNKLLASDPDYYRKLGAKSKTGGKNSPGSFTSETAKIAGAKGGSKSKRGKAKRIVKKAPDVSAAKVQTEYRIRPDTAADRRTQ